MNSKSHDLYDRAFVKAVALANRYGRSYELVKSPYSYDRYEVRPIVLNPWTGSPTEHVVGEVIKPGAPLTNKQMIG